MTSNFCQTGSRKSKCYPSSLCECCCESLWLALVVLVFALSIQLCSHFSDFGVVLRAYLLSYNSYANFYCVSLQPMILEICKTKQLLVRVNSDADTLFCKFSKVLLKKISLFPDFKSNSIITLITTAITF